MKKKLIPSLIASVILLSVGSQSAFAIKGAGDTRDTAITLYTSTTRTWTLDSFNDEDWFKWRNDTGSTKYVSASLQSPVGLNYDIWGYLVTPGGEYTLNTGENGPGGLEGFGTSLNPGDTIYIRIKPDSFDYSTTQQYEFKFNVN
ncbi:hypothetical protein AV654_07950 [Paenibacillus elgii]|uniref:Uncharacterized protein n=1 Tax=Paenibacillus elgii TaxID=189691 RepID=A0A164ABG3_9BACL|nr:hypothetical protein [Paenibacillus elgii]KZE83499.1 hypothetical protein AV654_07950 [Paenibacillus elgii]MCM3269433.1 hypothetical protein [Paenibacillus elgii]